MHPSANFLTIGKRQNIDNRPESWITTILASILVFSSLAIAEDEASPPKTAAPPTQTNQGGFYYDAQSNRYFSNADSVFSIRATEDPRYLERIEVSIDGGAFSPYQGKLAFKEEGLHLIRFRASDPVLNWSPIQDFRIQVDLTAPKSKPSWQGAQHQTDKGVFVNANSVLNIVAQDRLSGVANIKWKNGNQESLFPNNQSFKREGLYKVQFASIDHVGNREQWYSYQFTVDGSSPQTQTQIQGQSFKIEKGLYVSNGSLIVLSSQDALSGVEYTEYKINDGPLTRYNQPIALADKKIELKYRSVDFVGNKESWKSILINQDTTPPKVALKHNGTYVKLGGKHFARPGYTLNILSSDGDSGLKQILVSQDGKNFQATATKSFTFTKPGEYFLTVRAQDQVGNIAESNPTKIVIDQIAPQSQLTATDQLAQKEGIYISALPNQLKISATDAGVGVERVEYSYDGKTFKELKEGIDLAKWQNKQQSVFYRAVDRLGNTEAPKKITVHVRTTPPRVDLFVESRNYPNVPLSALKKQSSNRLPASQVSQEKTKKAKKSSKRPKRGKKKK